MTDKATVEMTSPVTGCGGFVCTRSRAQMATVGAPLVELDVEGAGNAQAASPPRPPLSASAKPKREEKKVAAERHFRSPSGGEDQGEGPAARKPATAPAFATRANGREKSARVPAIRRRAEESESKLQFVPGSGPEDGSSMAISMAYIARRQDRGGAARICEARRHRGDQGDRPQPQDRRENAGIETPHPHFAYVEEIDMTEPKACVRM